MTLFSNLSTLEMAGLIQVAKVEPDLEYHFMHNLVQDAAYASLLESDRKRLHLEVGDAIESLYPDRRKELAALLGYHFKEAGQDERALSYFLIAGDEALAGYANQEAETQYRRALELSCCSDEEIARCYTGLSEALYRQNHLDEALQALRTSVDIYKGLSDLDGIARLYARMARIVWYAGDQPEGLRLCLEGLELVKDAPDSWGKAKLLHETARAYYFKGASDKALPMCRQALTLAEKLSAVDIQADALATLGILSGVSPEESLAALSKSVELAEGHAWLDIAQRANHNLGNMTRAWKADNLAAMEYFLRAAEIGRMRGVAAEELMARLSSVSCLFASGKLNEIEAELSQLEQLTKKIPNPGTSSDSLVFMHGALLINRGDWEAGTSIFRECLQQSRLAQNHEYILNIINELTWVLFEQNRWEGKPVLDEIDKLASESIALVEGEDTNEKIWLYPNVALLRARQGRLEEAHQWLEKADQVAEKYPSTWNTILQSEAKVEIALAEGNWTEALQILEKSIDQQASLGFKITSAKDRLVEADILLRRGDPADLEKAQALLQQALSEFTEMGVGRYPQFAQERLQMIRTRIEAQTLKQKQMTQDLKKARQVQESLLPENLPEIAGWELAVALEPAHETSGDFYDFLPLLEGKLGVVIADVTDKGTSAALFMALSRSIWRTFAADNPTEPERTMEETNRRILSDTHGGLFITLFYGILDPQSGAFCYCSAGHHPVLLARSRDRSIEELGQTGIPLGVFVEAKWSQATAKIDPGDSVVLYTDGITDALNASEEFYTLDRLQVAVQKNSGKSAVELRDALLTELHDWVGDSPQFDDTTLMVITRSKS